MYAKMVLLPDGQKRYLPADDYDRALYTRAVEASRECIALPDVRIESGYNTNQVLNYGYTSWRQFFNERQLLCIQMLFDRLREIRDDGVRQLFEVHLSGVLEFNNMFTSFKGEGTGAVRHMFSHHILKPERTPLEANLWGTPKSSGSFSTLFRTRVLRAIDYRENPFELRVQQGKSDKVYGLSEPLGHVPAQTYAAFADGRPLYLSCGDSSQTDIKAESVDVVVTDPPFFDNVHYSQLADFFYVWLQRAGHDIANGRGTTRSPREVQHTDASVFSDRLADVFRECHRVLRRNGALVFTYHHSREEGWQSVIQSIIRSGFYITATQPVKAEMSVAAPKAQAADPIDIDIIIVCRKRPRRTTSPAPDETVLSDVANETRAQVARFNAVGRKLGRNDVRVVLMAQLAKRLSVLAESDASGLLDQVECDRWIASIHSGQKVSQ
jgi:adenine-specific DNA methylase